MMKLRFAGPLLLVLTTAGPIWAQQGGQLDSRPPANELPDDFYPTKSMVRFISERMSEDLKKQFQMDEQQAQMARESLEERLSNYLVENRKQVQPVINDFMKLFSQGQAPTAEAVQQFAQKALPVWESFQTTVRDTSESWREFLTEEQGVMLDGNLAAFDVGSKFLTERLQNWEQGGWDPETQWHKSPGFREANREEESRIDAEQKYASAVARGENPPVPEHLRESYGGDAFVDQTGVGGVNDPMGGGAVPDPGANVQGGGAAPVQRGVVPPAQRQDEWGIYVQQFSDRYSLTPEQRARAEQFLADARKQRDDWQTKNARTFARLEKLMATAKTEQGRETAKQQLEKKRAPFQTQFAKLKEKLEKLPTRAQRAAAAEPPPQANAVPAPPAAKPN